tara:strand:- start:10773 stop:11306 length:534 start_codon:yes stop_codon:yes gene_type:complete
MTVAINAEDPREEDGVALIADLDAHLSEMYEAQYNFFLGADVLAGDDTVFLVARDGLGKAVGCVALRDHGDFGEIKRMFVRESARRQGVAAELLDAAHRVARALGLLHVRLETGDRQTGAIALYQRAGYRPCDAFADYPADSPHNRFFDIHLPPPGADEPAKPGFLTKLLTMLGLAH